MPDEIIYYAAALGGGMVEATTFGPTSLSGLVMWLDALDTSTITTAAGAELVSWQDKSSNGLNMGELFPGSNPTLNTTGMGGLQSINYSGGNQVSAASYNAAMDFALGGSDGGYSYFFALQTNTATGTTGLFSRGRSTNGPYYMIYNVNTMLFRNATGGNVFIGVQGTALALSTPLIMGCIYSGSANFNAFEITVNGTAATVEASTSAAAYLGMVSDTGNLTFGNQGGSSTFFTGEIGEFILYNLRLTSSQQTQVTDYLISKWSI